MTTKRKAADGYISLKAAALMVPAIDGAHITQQTIYRWIMKGLYGIKLESGRVGTRIVTTSEAVQRFLKAIGVIQEAALKVRVNRMLDELDNARPAFDDTDWDD